jgi:hypothetical protein
VKLLLGDEVADPVTPGTRIEERRFGGTGAAAEVDEFSAVIARIILRREADKVRGQATTVSSV